MRSSLISLILLPIAVAAEPPPETGRLDDIPMHYVTLHRMDDAEAAIRIDGFIDEPVWQNAQVYDEMLVSMPGTGARAEHATNLRFVPTDRGLYASAVMKQPKETLIKRLTRRDQFIDRDNFGITIDATGNGSFAYWFIVAYGDTLMDGKVLPERRYSNDWDGPWVARTQPLEDGWTAELFLPWSMMSLPDVDGPRRIGFAVARTVSYRNERYQWPGHSQASPQFVTALNTLEVGDVKPRRQREIIPYISGTTDQVRGDDQMRIGADILWKPSPKFEVSAALNPDFGAVEADDVVLNLTALEVFFPEKRLFFLEGNEVFETTSRSSSGNNMRIFNAEDFRTTSRRVFTTNYLPAPISLINTRRFGGTASQLRTTQTLRRGEADRFTDLLGAAKITGSAGGLRYGVLGAFEDEVELIATDGSTVRDDGRDFAVLRAVYEANARDRYSIGYFGSLASGPLYDATVHAVDAHFSSADGRYGADVQWLSSDVDDITGDGALVDLSYRPDSRNRHTVRLDYFDETVNINDVGFLRRNDYQGGQYIYTYVRDGFGPTIANRGGITLEHQKNLSEDRVVRSGIYWRNTAIWPGRNTVRTAFAYFPERYEDIDTRGTGSYRTAESAWWDVLAATDSSKPLEFSFGVGGWREHLGDWTYQAKAGMTWRPTANFSAALDLTYRARDGWLVYQGANNFGAYHGTEWQPTLDLSWFLSAAHQLKLRLQWAGVRASERGFYAVPARSGDLLPAARTRANHDFNVSLMTAQIRYRWEIAPLTDLFVVYNRGNNQRTGNTTSFEDLFTDAFDDPLVDLFIIKLRYRFSN